MFRKMLLLLIVLLPVVGCGIEWFPDGTKPNSFSFATKTGVQLSTPTESNTVTITGNSYTSPISVANGEYKIADGNYTSAAGTISAGQTVTVRHTSSASYGTATTTTLTIGGVSGTFTSVTIAKPILNNISSFSFATKTGVELSTLVESDPVTITGTNAPWPIAVTNGEYSIDAAAYTSAAGTINKLQSVKVRHTSASTYSTTTTTILSVGHADIGEAVSVGFSSVTKDSPAPFSNFSTFPPLTTVNASADNVVSATNPTAQRTGTTDPVTIQFSFNGTNGDTTMLRTFHGLVAGLDGQNRKIHPGYFQVDVGIPANSFAQLLSVTVSSPAISATTFNSITHWVFRQITYN